MSISSAVAHSPLGFGLVSHYRVRLPHTLQQHERCSHQCPHDSFAHCAVRHRTKSLHDGQCRRLVPLRSLYFIYHSCMPGYQKVVGHRTLCCMLWNLRYMVLLGGGRGVQAGNRFVLHSYLEFNSISLPRHCDVALPFLDIEVKHCLFNPPISLRVYEFSCLALLRGRLQITFMSQRVHFDCSE